MAKKYYIKGKRPHKQKSIEDLNEKSFDELYPTLQKLYDEERYDEMFPYCMKCIELNPFEKSLNYYMGLALATQGQYSEAAEYLDVFLKDQKNNQDALINAGRANEFIDTFDSVIKGIRLYLKAERGKNPNLSIDDLINGIKDKKTAEAMAYVFNSRLPE